MAGDKVAGTKETNLRLMTIFIYLSTLLVSCRTVNPELDSSLRRAEIFGKKCPWKSSKDVVISPQDYGTADPDRTLSKEEVLEDVACLVDLFRMQYSAGDYYNNLGRAFSIEDRAREVAARLGPVSNYKLLNELFDSIHKDAYDGHLRYWLAGDKNSNVTPLNRVSPQHVPYMLYGKVNKINLSSFIFNYKDNTGRATEIELKSCDGMDIRKLTTDGSNQINVLIGSFPFNGAGIQVVCTPKDSSVPTFTRPAVPLITPEVKNDSGKRVTWEKKANGILYVRIWEVGQMDQQSRWSTDQEELLKILQDLPADQKIVIDYRNTGTGDSTYATLLAETLYKKDSPLDGPVGTQKISLYTRAGQVSKMNYVIFDPRAYGSSTLTQADHVRTRDAVQKLLDNLELDGFTLETSKIVKIERSTGRSPVGRDTELTQPIIVLTDGFCGSTCGMALAALRNHPKVKFFGTNSAGNLHFMSPGDFMLPRSRIKLTLSPTSFSYTPEFDDAVGYAPDIYYVGTDPVEAAMKYLETLAQQR